MLNWLTKRFNRQQGSVNREGVLSSVELFNRGIHGTLMRPFHPQAGVDAFRSWVYVASMANAKRVAETPLRLYARKSEGSSGAKRYTTRPMSLDRRRKMLDDPTLSPSVRVKLAEIGSDFEEVVEDHPAMRLLRDSNPFTSGYMTTTIRILHQELTGNAYMHPIIGDDGTPVELWQVFPQWMWVIPDEQEYIRGYWYSRTGAKTIGYEFEPDEIIHFKYPHPDNMYYGLGKVEAAWGILQIHNEKRATDHALYANGARPDYAAVVKSGASPTQIAEFESRLNQKLKGSSNAGRSVAITGDVTLVPMSFPPRDIGDPERVIDEIAGVFGLPREKLIGNTTHANRELAEYDWRSNTIRPLCRQDEEVLNERYLALFDDSDGLALAYDDPVSEDEDRRQEILRNEANAGLRTINEVRSEFGLQDLPGGDELRFNGVPISTIGQPAPMPTFNIGQPSLPSPAATPGLPANPTTPTAARPAAEDVSATALTGAQLTALQGIVTAWSSGELSRASAIGMAIVAFPAVPRQAIEDIFRDMPERTPETEPVADVPTKATKSYEDIDFSPPEGAREEARRGLEWRKEFGRGGTEVGVARARDISNGANLSPDTIGRMVSYFARHEVDKQGEGWSPGEDGYPSAGRIAWALWGGDPGKSWAEKVSRQMEREDEGEKSINLPIIISAKRYESKEDYPPEVKEARMAVEEVGDAADDIREGEPRTPAEAMAKNLIRVFSQQEAAILAMIDGASGLKARTARDEALAQAARIVAELDNAMVVQAVQRPMESIILAGGVNGLNRIGVSSAFDVINPFVETLARDHALALAGQVNQTTLDAVTNTMADGLANGENIQQLKRRVQAAFKDAEEWRALTIARTESARAYVDGQEAGWTQVEAVQGKQWLLAPNACPFCEEVNRLFANRVIALGDPFFPKDTALVVDGKVMRMGYSDVMGAPLHPNCRCDVLPVLE